jgi:hypothetical protein
MIADKSAANGRCQAFQLPPGFFMGPIVNLRAERKRAKRRQAEQIAASNRLAHGRSKMKQNLERSRSDKARSGLDQHRIERGDGK